MSKRPFSIVCAVDLSEISPAVIEHALAEAHRHDTVSMHFLTVAETRKGRFSKQDPSQRDLEETDQNLRALVRESLSVFADDREGLKREVRFHTRMGKADEQILELALEARADRIIVGRHSNPKHRKPMGGISAAVVNAAACTVEIVQVADYGAVEEEYEQCAECVLVRERSGGSSWFCGEHSDGRMPRLSGSVGVTSYTPGWGIF
jgi:nucleotide-binding universal stress UspA family protein